jgi:hypothetical protein
LTGKARYRAGGLVGGAAAERRRDMAHEYALYRWNKPHINGYVTAHVGDDKFWIEDYTASALSEEIFGHEDYEYCVTVDKAGAEKILEKEGVMDTKYPIDTLALIIADAFDGCPDAASMFRNMAERAGVEPEVWVW